MCGTVILICVSINQDSLTWQERGFHFASPNHHHQTTEDGGECRARKLLNFKTHSNSPSHSPCVSLQKNRNQSTNFLKAIRIMK